MRFFFFSRAIWLSSVVTAELITITEYCKCSTSALFPAPTNNSTVPASAYSSSSSSSATTVSTSAARPTAGGFVLGGIGPGAAASVKTKDIANLFWLNYARAIMEIIPFQPGGNSAFFIGSIAQKGPVAGDNMAEEYTNFGLHDIANNLLNDSSPFYQPSGLNGYVETLRNYLAFVDSEGKPSPSDDLSLLNARQEMAAANARVGREGADAAAAWQKQVDLGILDDTEHPLLTWLSDGNYPSYNTALKDRQAIATRIDQLRARIDGPKAVALNEDRDSVGFGLSPDSHPGFNMLAASGNLKSARELGICNELPPCPAPASTFRLPLYSSPRYISFIKEAQVKAPSSDPGPQLSANFSVNTGESASSFDFGQSTTGAAARGNWWFSFKASGERTTESSTSNTEVAASTTLIKITYDKIEAVPIIPGKWNVNLNGYKLSKDAPANLRQLVRPTQLVVASRLGYEITVGTTFAAQLDTHFKQTTKASGGFRIFGLTIWGGSSSRTDERNTHSASYNAETRTLKILPDNDVGTATLVGGNASVVFRRLLM